MSDEMRSESAVFRDLEQLCTSAGYIHVFATLVVKNTFVRYSGNLKGRDFDESFGDDHLIRTELSTLLGLMVRGGIQFALPTPEQQGYFEAKTLELLQELHHSLSSIGLVRERLESLDLANGPFLREPIFYTGESAYASQYRDLAPRKYEADAGWIQEKQGFTIAEAAKITKAVLALEQVRIGKLYNSLRHGVPENFTFLPGFTFTPQDLLKECGVCEATIVNVLNSFCLSQAERNESFQALNDFNLASAKPIIRCPDGAYILFQAYSMFESLYDSPFYWMIQDDSYKDQAFTNRGRFTERTAAEFLERVFDKKHVHSNVTIEINAANRAGEIDTLVLFGNRAIVIQAKSKRLTIDARRGNDGAIRKDFAKAVADSYGQALCCARDLLSRTWHILDSSGRHIAVPKLNKVYLLCLVLDHYPALGFQVAQFLEPVVSGDIPYPLVADVFALDVMTEMLSSPLHLLSYLDRRTEYGDRLFAGHELTILGYHLTQNLWISGPADVIYLADDVASHLDAAMAVRRDGLSGERVPTGILTLNAGTPYANLVAQLDNDPRGDLLDVGFLLLKMSSETADQVSQGIKYVRSLALKDRKLHDFSMGCGRNTGITIHCSYLTFADGMQSLQKHVLRRKYRTGASSWFGIAVNPDDGLLLFGYNAEFDWEWDSSLDAICNSMSNSLGLHFKDGRPQQRKVGRNNLCPCGSGKKYKKCHLDG